MPPADLHASTCSLHIIKATGCVQWLHLCPSPHRLHRAPHADLSQLSFWASFPAKREMGVDEIYAYMRWNSFWGEHMELYWQKRDPFAPISIIFTTMSPATQCHHLESGSVMNVRVHIVSKYISVAPTLNPFVLHFSLVLLISSLLWLFPANCDYFNLFLGFGMSISFFKNKCDNQSLMNKYVIKVKLWWVKLKRCEKICQFSHWNVH